MIKTILANKIFKNFSILTGTNIVIQLISILSSIRLTRLLQPEGYGLYNLMMVEIGIFSIIAAYGLRLVIVRYVARNKSHSNYVFNVSNRIRLVTTMIAVFCLITYNLYINEIHFTPYMLFILSMCIVFQSSWDSIESIAFGNEKMEASGYINLIFTTLWVSSIFIIPKADFKIEVLFTVFILIQFLKTITYYYWFNRKILKQYQNEKIEVDLNHYFFIRQSNYYFILAIFSTIQTQIPVLLLNHNSTLDQVGIFNLGYRILSPLSMVLNTALVSLYPSLSRLAVQNKELFTKNIKSLINLLVVIGIWACLCFTLFSQEVVQILFGEEYLGAVKVILIQCWFTLLYGIFSTIGTVLSSFDRQRQLAILSIIHGILAIPILYYGTKYGAIGLAWAFVISGCVNMTYHWVIFRKLLSPFLDLSYTFKLFSILITTAICSLFIPFDFGIGLKFLSLILISFLSGYYIKRKVESMLIT
ncbi:oligosaccharide flippase family protein [Cyclobacterium plantarum]|uniref:oligosaccharide flippase family protein n=1 Tax=Cyclobacterium plantarum TaxID=2716263 RepID=UPI003F6ED295